MNPKPLSSLNHFTVPVAIVPSRGYVRCETRRCNEATTAKTRALLLVEHTPDPYDESSGPAAERPSRADRSSGAPPGDASEPAPARARREACAPPSVLAR